VKLSTKLAIVLWSLLILSGLLLAVKLVAAAAAALFALVFWLGITAITVGSVWILHNKFETWLDDRANRKTQQGRKRWVPWS